MGRKRIIALSSLEETIEIGKRMASLIYPNSILALSGDLGAGKTTLVQGLALGLQITDPIQSPTFVYMNQYSGTIPLFHFDLYRMKNEGDFLGMGFEEYFEAGGICAIEWPEKIPSLLPARTLFLSLSHQNQGRSLTISGAFPHNLLNFSEK